MSATKPEIYAFVVMSIRKAPSCLIKNILADMAKKSKKTSDYKESLTKAYRSLKIVNKFKHTDKILEILGASGIWNALLIGWFFARQLDTDRTMEELDDDKDSMKEGNYLVMCNAMKLAHSLRNDFCCICCLDDDFKIKE